MNSHILYYAFQSRESSQNVIETNVSKFATENSHSAAHIHCKQLL